MKFCEKNVLCEKGDEITRFDGIWIADRKAVLHCKYTVPKI
jgi:hypothetical protein